MNKGPNQPQHPGNRGRRRHRRGKGQQNQPGSGPQQGMRGPGGQGGGNQNRGRRRHGNPQFVGPMDHSYRNAPGAGNDLYPQNGRYRGQGRSGPQQPVNGAATEEQIAAAANAPSKIVCFIDDLFFLAKIQETARKLGVKVEFVKAEKETIDRLTSADEQKPSLIIFDLNNANAKPLVTIPKLKGKLKKQTSIVGFLSHLQGDLKVKAQEAGCDMVVPRSAFSQNLPALLRRHSADLQDGLE
jgi:ActR/RegA family two-component response regulator